jgi:hypothetical protein
MGPLPAGQSDPPTPTAIDSAPGRRVLHPDYAQPNTTFTKTDGTKGENADGRGAHNNHLHFQLGETGFKVTRSQ